MAHAGGGTLVVDSRYDEQASTEVGRPYRVRVFRKGRALDAAARVVRSIGAVALGVDFTKIPHAAYIAVRKAVAGVKVRNAAGLVSHLRAVKDSTEVELIRRSAALLDKGFAMAGQSIKAGAIEREVADSVEMRLRRRGATRMSFDTIIATGKRGALPHGLASDERIASGDLVVVDMGVVLEGYCSDETRTFCAGKASKRARKIYTTVLEAHDRAIEKVRAGVRASVVDSAARSHIKKAGFGKYFGHATGHGVGLEIHEPPFVGPKSTDTLTEGMVITVEPGIYIPGFGGVRIEDMLLVTSTGCEVLTNAPRELVCL